MLCVINSMEVSSVLNQASFFKSIFHQFLAHFAPTFSSFMLQGSIKEILLLIYEEKKIFMNIKQA